MSEMVHKKGFITKLCNRDNVIDYIRNSGFKFDKSDDDETLIDSYLSENYGKEALNNYGLFNISDLDDLDGDEYIATAECVSPNAYSVDLQFHNGGCSTGEAIEDALDDI